MPFDQSFGLTDSEDKDVMWFFLGGNDLYHFIVNDDFIMEGMHRSHSLKQYYEENNIYKKHPAIRIPDDYKFKEPLYVECLNDKYGHETQLVECIRFNDFMLALRRTYIFLTDILFEYERLNGKPFPPSRITTDYKYLMEKIDERSNTDS